MGNITSSHDQTRLMALLDKQINISENGVERSYTDLPIEVKNPLSYDKHFLFTLMNMILPEFPLFTMVRNMDKLVQMILVIERICGFKISGMRMRRNCMIKLK